MKVTVRFLGPQRLETKLDKYDIQCRGSALVMDVINSLKIIFPNDALMLDQWRARKISIKDLKVTNMENVNDFYNRIIDFIHSCKKNENENTFIVVCTTSVVIMLINIIVLGANFNFKSYYHYNVKTGDYLLANIKTDLTLELVETSVNLE